MEGPKHPNDPRHRDAESGDRSETGERTPPPHPRFTGDSPHPGYTVETSGGVPRDLDASYDDAPGLVAPEQGRAHDVELIVGRPPLEDPGNPHAPGESHLPGDLEVPDRPHAPGDRFPPGEYSPPGGPEDRGDPHAPGEFHPPGDAGYPGHPYAPGDRFLPDVPFPPVGPEEPEYLDPPGEYGTVIGTDFADELDGDERSNVMIGLAGDDLMFGHGGNDDLRGDDGDDLLVGGFGQDRLIGGWGDDVLVGEAGDDYLRGGDGDDVLIGGAGNDSLIGGDGADIFAFVPPIGEDGTVPRFGDDVIYDFNEAEGDMLDFGTIHDDLPSLFLSMRHTEDGDVVIMLTESDGTAVGSVTLHRFAYQPVGGFPHPGMPHEPGYEHGGYPDPPFAPGYEHGEHPDPDSLLAPGHMHGEFPRLGVSEFLPPWIAFHAETGEVDAM